MHWFMIRGGGKWNENFSSISRWVEEREEKLDIL